MKKRFILIALSLLIVFAFSGMAHAEDIKILVNGNSVAFDTPPVLQESTTYVPLRVVGEALNAQVGWSGSDQTAIVRKNYDTSLSINTPVHQKEGLSLEINGTVIENAQLLMVDNRVLVPIRIISEYLGAQVGWDGSTRTATIDLKEVDPFAVLTKAEKKLLEIPAYSFYMVGTTSMTYSINEEFAREFAREFAQEFAMEEEMDLADMSILDGMQMDVDMEVEGIYRSPFEMYLKFKMDMSQALENMLTALEEEISALDDEEVVALEEEMSALQTMEMEMYMRDEVMYMKMFGGEWIKSEFPALSQQFNPEVYVDMLGTLINEANYKKTVMIDGKSHHVIEFALDTESYMELISEALDVLAVPDIPEMPGFDFSEMIKEFNASYVYYIDAEDFTLKKVSSEVQMVMEFMFFIIDTDAVLDVYYDYENIGEMPVIP
ncbi:MAG: copper amine oxidase N-terminal domain-containing protein [Bacillota bacterium]